MMNIYRRHLYIIGKRSISQLTSSFNAATDVDIDRVRNIGIMAHIDAGKTTTTERMLYYADVIPTVGEVHHGDTVMDYMEQERNRGITITSAAISFKWGNGQINLIDTPGHVDFTIEVERSLRVLDGAVTILDGAAGVQAQTLTVWRQASRYNVPTFIFINKMDKERANLEMCLDSIKRKLHVKPLLLHLPIGSGVEFQGVMDLITMDALQWNPEGDRKSKAFSRNKLFTVAEEIYEFANRQRANLIDSVAELDDTLLDIILTKEHSHKVTPEELSHALRRVTIARKGFPVLCGSAYKNMCIPLVLDNILNLLPAPTDITHAFVDCYGGNLCALVFKIVFDKQKGPLTFVRIFSGNMEPGQKIYNINQKKSEKIQKVLLAYADEYQEVPSVKSGHIAVITGFKDTITGDTLTASVSSAKNALKSISKVEEDPESAVLAGIQVPEPVFFCSIEPNSQAYQTQLEHALTCLQKEDPSFRVKYDGDTGQTVLLGMGELHLSIMCERIRKEYKVEVEQGPLQIAYREGLQKSAKVTYTLDKRLGDIQHRVMISLEAVPNITGPPTIKLAHSKENVDNLSSIKPQQLKCVQQGINMAVGAGPLLSSPVIDVGVNLHWLEIKPKTSDPMITSAAAECFRQALTGAGTYLLEPMMKLEVEVGETYCPGVIADLTNRRAIIQEIGQSQEMKVVWALVPLAELRDYSTSLRIITSGLATFTLEFHSYHQLSAAEQRKVIELETGFQLS